jgi:hypothetical protein
VPRWLVLDTISRPPLTFRNELALSIEATYKMDSIIMHDSVRKRRSQFAKIAEGDPS